MSDETSNQIPFTSGEKHKSSKGDSDSNRKSNFLSLREKSEVLQRLEQGALATDLAREYGISKSTISRFKKKKDTIHNAVTTIYPNNAERRTLRGTFYKKTEEVLYQWYLEQRQNSIEVNGSMIREKAQQFYNEYEKDGNASFCASAGWLVKFKRRYGIQSVNGHQSIAESQEKSPQTPKISNNRLVLGKEQSQRTKCVAKPVDRKDAIESVDTLIRWSKENSVDSLYLTMLSNLKDQIKIGLKVRHICK